VSLELHQDETYTLVRESMSGHNAPEVIQGTIRFADASRQQLELLQVNTRNLLYVDLEKQFASRFSCRSNRQTLSNAKLIFYSGQVCLNTG